MSSYIVELKCMQRIINGLFWSHRFKEEYRPLYDAQSLNEAKDYEALAKRLYEMNKKAVKARYGKSNVDVPKFEWSAEPAPNIYQLLKSLQCLKYQCNEGNVSKSKLFKWLKEVVFSVMFFIIWETKEYKKSEWS